MDQAVRGRRASILLVMGTSAVLAACSNVLLRYAMGSLDVGDETLDMLVGGFTSPLVLGGLFGYAVSQLLWLNVLSEARLGAAFPVFLGSTFIIVLGASTVFLGERLTLYRVGGTLLVTLGIVISEWTRTAAKGAEP